MTPASIRKRADMHDAQSTPGDTSTANLLRALADVVEAARQTPVRATGGAPLIDALARLEALKP